MKLKLLLLDFDVAMGAYDGAEVSELVGLFLLDEIIRADIGLKKEFLGIYRDDGLAVIRTSTRILKRDIGPELAKVLKKHALDIEVEYGDKTVDFLDLTLYLMEGTRPI